MPGILQRIPRYFWLELGFVFFLTLPTALISDLEYSAYEEGDIRRFSANIAYRLVTELLEMVPLGLYYWGFLRRYVFRKQILGIVLCSVAFVFVDRLFGKYVVNWALVHADFVSEHLRQRAFTELHRPRLFFLFNYLILSSILPLVGLAFVVRSLTQDRQMKELEAQQARAELNYLKSQLHPHFFFNTINNIYGLALKHSDDTAPMVARLGEMMRYILYEADKATVPLSRELAFLESYIDVETMRYRHDSVRISLDVQCPRQEAEIAPLLLLPLVENAFKHGLEQEAGAGFVNVVICQTEGELVLEVHNSKPVGAASYAQGIGLTNLRKRLDLLYPGRHDLSHSDESGGYRATLNLQTA